MIKWFRWYIRAVNRLGFKKEPEAFDIMVVNLLFGIDRLASNLRKGGYYYNDFSTTYKGQLYTVRALVDLDHQIHLRIYKDRITGHYELRPEHATEHLKGVELRQLNPVEIEAIRETLQ